MRIYVTSPGARKDVDAVLTLGLGVLISANASIRSYMNDVPIALDNGAYRSWLNCQGFDEFGFLRTLHHCLERGLRLEWLVTPDIVAAGRRSLEFSLFWRRRLEGHTQYLAVQDGLEISDVEPCIALFDGLFVGGTMPWKLKTAREWICLAHSYGKPCHIGRIGTVERLIWAETIGADSVDSSSFTRNGTIHYCSEYRRARETCPTLF